MHIRIGKVYLVNSELDDPHIVQRSVSKTPFISTEKVLQAAIGSERCI
jgi:hypothetical protein